ncbi:BlaI/MecI/CopY family transcriptional regulator [Epilithonimonas hungarica]|uniref:Predicted transcriptional regulator n=1 Tax=Epilithonimonas hungarica TaxID=454006 RepID=A0A1G7JGH4_9FLAO|nr:BlaI/MecI/CopY family transcriptional regulator [Epilithonimonas hungarica]SDF23589.1 Predicted transcriptional regulator [Epilithonimonas hungarica]
MIIQPLTSSEEEIMKLVWEKEAIYFRELMDIFPEPKPHQNTVSTFLKILVEKNYLKTEKQGRIYLYKPAVGFMEYRKFVLKRFLDNYFHNSGSELLKVLMDEKLVRPNDFSQFFEVKTTVVPLQADPEKENPIQDFIKEITSGKKSKKKDKDKKKKKKKS